MNLEFYQKMGENLSYLKNNQEAHGPPCLTEKHFQTIKKPEESYDCTRRLVKSHYYFSMALYLNKQEFPLLKDAFCQVRLKLIKWFSIRRFLNFAIISLLKRGWPFIWTNLNPLYPKMLCAKWGWNWTNGRWEDV